METPTVLTYLINSPKNKTTPDKLTLLKTRGAKKIKLVIMPRDEIGASKMLEMGEFVALSQFKKEEISQIPPPPIPCGKCTE